MRLEAAAGASDHDRVLAHLNARGFIQFHPGIAAKLGFKAALFLGHGLYWSQYLNRHEPLRHGWFFMTSRQWQDATALTAREQAAVRADLVGMGLIQEALAGQPAKLHFKVDLPAVMRLLDLQCEGPIAWDQIAVLMRSSVRFYKPLADLAGSIGAGLYLSKLLHLARHAAHAASPFLRPSEFVIRPEDVRVALGLGPKAQRNARDQLKASGLLQDGRIHQACQSVRLNYAAIIACVEAQPKANPPTSRPADSRTNGQVDGYARERWARPLHTAAACTGTSLIQIPARTEGTTADQHGLQPTGAALIKHSDRQLSLFCGTGAALQNQARPAIAASCTTPSTTPCATPPTTPSPPTSTAMPSPFGVTVASKGLFGDHELAAARNAGSTAQASVPLAKPAATTTTTQTAAPQFAVLSKQACPFVETRLPFCRNIQGIDSSIQTTTTTRGSVDNSTSRAAPCRRRGQQGSQDPGTTALGADEVPKTAAHGAGADATTPSCDDALVMPVALDAQWHRAIRRALQTVPAVSRQALLDELAGQMAAPGKLIHNPPGWLLALARRFAQGTAVLALADKVQADRQARERHLRVLEQALQGLVEAPPSPAAALQEHTTPLRQHVERLRAVQRDLKAGQP